MCAKWNSNYNPQPILDAIAGSVSVTNQGTLTYTRPTIDDYIGILVSAFEFSSGIHTSTQKQIVDQGLREALRKGKLTSDRVREAVTKTESSYLSRPVTEYVLATSISVIHPLPFRTARLMRHTLTFSRELPRPFAMSQVCLRIKDKFSAGLPSNYVIVRVNGRGRCALEAVEGALDALALFRGIWNLCLTRGAFRLTFGYQPQIAEIVLGPVHTLHLPNGKLATETFWYEPSYRKPADCVDLSSKYTRLRKIERWIHRQLARAKDEEQLVRAFVRYASALDEPLMEHAFLRLWGVLEMLTCTGNDSYAKTIRRAAFLWKDKEYARQELQHLRDIRNQAVHQDKPAARDSVPVYQLKRYIDELFLFLLDPSNVSQVMEETALFLDSPGTLDEVRKKIALYRKAARFLGAKSGQ